MGDAATQPGQEIDAPEAERPHVAPTRILFTPAMLRRQLLRDAAIRVAVLLATAAGVAVVIGTERVMDAVVSSAVLVVLLVAMAMNAVSARVSRELPKLAPLLDRDHEAAEAMLAQLLKRKPLVRWVRLMLYHRLAVLRHRQQRWADSASIAEAVLAQPMGPAGQVRPHLLLMLAEARMQLGQPAHAWPALMELHATPLKLVERLQGLALQTRYEVMVDRPDAALRKVREKVQMAELMPAAQCGAMHAMLATAAERLRHAEYADWLWARARLLLTPAQLEVLTQGRSGIGVVEAAHSELE